MSKKIIISLVFGVVIGSVGTYILFRATSLRNSIFRVRENSSNAEGVTLPRPKPELGPKKGICKAGETLVTNADRYHTLGCEDAEGNIRLIQ